ncbi:MAG: 1,2-diacylglycerol 3-glucosyltransferase [Parcubacteria bacterium C7867-008]|nr:MAG: 1,2-diacylglycerol 3-glucosyltransferase [Parcubacteria bacterium C7867-008]
MKRVLIFSLAYYPSFVSGAEAAIKEITDRIDPSDVEFHLITLLFEPKAPRTEKIGNTQIYRVGLGGAFLSKALFIPLAALKAASLHRRLEFNGMWAMMTYMTMPTMLAKFLGVRVPHIITFQDGDPYEKVFERTFIKPLTPLIDAGIRSASVIQVISSYLGTWPPKRGYTGRIELIHNGANPKDLHESVSEQEIITLQQKIGKKEGDIWLVNTARLVHQKGYEDTICALTSLPEHVKLVIVGGGPDDAALKTLATELNLNERVIFIGPVDRSEVTAYRKASDIFVGPSRSEGLGNAFLSAMASRLPVVATREGGLAEFVFDEKYTPDKTPTAWVVEKDSPEQIAEAVKDILAHPEKVKQVTKNARVMVLENYDWDLVAKQMQERIFNPTLQ